MNISDGTGTSVKTYSWTATSPGNWNSRTLAMSSVVVVWKEHWCDGGCGSWEEGEGGSAQGWTQGIEYTLGINMHEAKGCNQSKFCWPGRDESVAPHVICHMMMVLKSYYYKEIDIRPVIGSILRRPHLSSFSLFPGRDLGWVHPWAPFSLVCISQFRSVVKSVAWPGHVTWTAVKHTSYSATTVSFYDCTNNMSRPLLSALSITDKYGDSRSSKFFAFTSPGLTLPSSSTVTGSCYMDDWLGECVRKYCMSKPGNILTFHHWQKWFSLWKFSLHMNYWQCYISISNCLLR